MLLDRIFITAAVLQWDWQQNFGKKSNNKTANCTAVNTVVLCGIFHVYCQPAAGSSIFHLFLNVLTAVPVVPRHAGGGEKCWCLCRGRGVARLRVVAAAAGRTVCAVV